MIGIEYEWKNPSNQTTDHCGMPRKWGLCVHEAPIKQARAYLGRVWCSNISQIFFAKMRKRKRPLANRRMENVKRKAKRKSSGLIRFGR